MAPWHGPGWDSQCIPTSTHLQAVHHHEIDVVHVTLVGKYLLLHLGQVFFQVNLDIVEPGAEKYAEHQHPRGQRGQRQGVGATLGLTRIAAAASGGRTGQLGWCPCTPQRVTIHFLACTLWKKGKRKEGCHYLASKRLWSDLHQVESSSFTPFSCLMLRVGFASHKLYELLNDLG